MMIEREVVFLVCAYIYIYTCESTLMQTRVESQGEVKSRRDRSNEYQKGGKRRRVTGGVRTILSTEEYDVKGTQSVKNLSKDSRLTP